MNLTQQQILDKVRMARAALKVGCSHMALDDLEKLIALLDTDEGPDSFAGRSEASELDLRPIWARYRG